MVPAVNKLNYLKKDSGIRVEINFLVSCGWVNWQHTKLYKRLG